MTDHKKKGDVEALPVLAGAKRDLANRMAADGAKTVLRDKSAYWDVLDAPFSPFAERPWRPSIPRGDLSAG